MKKSRRVYVGLLTTAIAALGVDQIFLQSEPGAASAAAVAPMGGAPIAPPSVGASENDQTETLAQVLASLGAPLPVDRNCFAIPEYWHPRDTTLDVAPQTDPLPPLMLTSTSPVGAVINGRPVRIGAFVDTDESIRLVSVGESEGAASAIVEFSGVRYRLLVGAKTPELLDEAPESADRADRGG